MANRKSGCVRSFFVMLEGKQFEEERANRSKKMVAYFGMLKCVFFGFWAAYLIENSNVLDVTGVLKNCG